MASTPSTPREPPPAPYEASPPTFDLASGALRFWVDVGGVAVGASMSKQALHYRLRGDANGNDAVAVYHAHRAELEAAVRRRLAAGSLEPILLRESDLPELPR
jgi:Protein of unknown function (DUF1488)